MNSVAHLLYPDEVIALVLREEGLDEKTSFSLATKIINALSDYSNRLPLTDGIPAILFSKDEYPDWVEVILCKEDEDDGEGGF